MADQEAEQKKTDAMKASTPDTILPLRRTADVLVTHAYDVRTGKPIRLFRERPLHSAEPEQARR